MLTYHYTLHDNSDATSIGAAAPSALPDLTAVMLLPQALPGLPHGRLRQPAR